MPGVFPSWLTPLPAIIALIESLSFWACSSGLIMITPQPYCKLVFRPLNTKVSHVIYHNVEKSTLVTDNVGSSIK